MQHATEATAYETAACLIQYSQADSAETLTVDEINALATVQSFVGSSSFDESLSDNGCKAFADFSD